jgi:hypothetical protein
MKRKLITLFVAGALTLLLTAGVALASNIACDAGLLCKGTPQADVMTGINADNTISAFGSDDIVNDTLGPDRDVLRGMQGNDTINAKEGSNASSNRDFVNCGAGSDDTAIVDSKDQVMTNCENVKKR